MNYNKEAEDRERDDAEDIDDDDMYVPTWRRDPRPDASHMWYENRPSNVTMFRRQGNVTAETQGTPEIPHMKDDTTFRKVVYASKHRQVKARASEVKAFVQLAREKFSQETVKLTKQAWSPSKLASGIFKIYDEDNNYKCTGTLVSGYMYVVAHVLSEDSTKKYFARNHEHSLVLEASKSIICNKEIVAFPTCGIPSVFKNTQFKTLVDAGIVTIYGFGNGERSSPDAVIGFASPLGWCNAKTRCGDCSAPALDEEGNIVGFWTHGNGVSFGRFEPITDDFKQFIGEMHQSVTHVGLDFRSRPLSPSI